MSTHPAPIPYPPAAELAALLDELPGCELPLDSRSWMLEGELLKQSLGNVKLSEDVWLEPITSALHFLSEALTSKLIVDVAQTAIVEWKAKELVNKARCVSDKKKGKEKEKVGTGEDEALKAQEARREVWREAREMLHRDHAEREGEREGEGVATGSGVTSTSEVATADAEGENKDDLDESADEAAWETVPDLPRLAHFRIQLHATYVTVGAVKSGAAAFGVSFVPYMDDGKKEGHPLFGKDALGDLTEQDLKHIQLVGGTFYLTCTQKDFTKLERVLELLAFATLSLKLEAHLLRDTQCPRPRVDDDVAEESETDTSNTVTPIGSIHEDQEEFPSEDNSFKKGHRLHWSKGKIWGFLTGSSSGASQSPTSPHTPESPSKTPRKVSNKIRDGIKDGFRLRKTRSIRRREASSSSRRTGSSSLDLDRLDTWDFIGGLGLGLGIGNVKTAQEGRILEDVGKIEPEKKKEGEEESTERFQRVILKMERCVLSVSPNVIYPPPHLLVRLRQQEVEQLATAPPVPFKHVPPLPPKPAPFLSPLGFSARPPVDRMRSYGTIDAQTLAMDFASGFSAGDASTTASLSSTTSRATRISLDARAGLASLMTNNNSLAGTFRHQSMQFLVEAACPDAEGELQQCKAPKWLAFSYFVNHLSGEQAYLAPDVSLGQFIEQLVDRRDLPCETAGCKKVGREHVLQWMHSKERISVSVASMEAVVEKTSEEKSVELHGTTEPSRPRISTWTTCKTCQARTPPSLLSLASYLFSFSKFAELLLYDPDFVPMPELCAHASTDRNALVRSFAIGKTVVNISLDEIELFELRLPTSVDPDIVHEAQPRMEADASLVELLRLEIKAFYQSVHTRLDTLASLLHESSGENSTLKRAPHLADEGETPRRARSGSEATIIEDGVGGGGTLKSTATPLQLLYRLRDGLEDDETDLLGLIDDVGPDKLNSGRWYFLAKAKAARTRIEAWESKHSSDFAAAIAAEPLPPPSYDEPEYTASDVHVFPVESSVLVRESELSSAIALTLSAPAFREEVALIGSTVGTPRKATPQSFRAPPTPSGSRVSSRQPIPLELLEGLKPDVAVSAPNTPPRSPRPPSTARAATLDPDDPTTDFGVMDDLEFMAKPKKDVRAGSMILGGLGGVRGSLARQPSADSFARIFRASPVPTPTSETFPALVEEKKPALLSDQILEDLVSKDEAGPPPSPRPGPTHALPSVIKQSLNKRNASEATTSRLVSALWNLPGSIRGSGFAPKASPAVHIKFNFRHGDKSFRVTAYFARRFQELRTRCGLSEDLFVESLARCTDLTPDGGKSKAGFWITSDRRFLLKQLTSKWGVSEKDAFLSFAPELLTYLSNPERPSLLAKIYGFYTIKLKNLKTNKVTKLDVVVMEHLFHSQTITRQFDLKGVASRVAKAKTEGGATGWDADWLSVGSLQSRLLLYSHSKTLLRESLLNDTAFLSRCGIIDYSLLIGVDDSRRELVVGIIDSLGVFNTLKMLENAGKTALKKATAADADDVTVIPPADYAHRFRQGMERSFVSVPEKFSKPAEGEMDTDPRLASPL
ncbi:hypothetical protein MNV49_000539 [Pseudohyphozyma bogoriensis]|nr:hypothetical protein MNV49_000539 [Pseudohyphozyma bogoriensis]